MAKYLIQAGYTAEGAKGLLKEGGTGRRRAVDEAVASVGGSVEAMYYAYGDDDLVIIVDFPDTISMAAVSLMVKASGALHTRATPLLTVEETDEAARRQVAFRPPEA
ncbi:GYD domain-containing protein [Streptomyces sp. PTM05]|uniref:GYD domain-containing protein n=1 Tax=Streptantibioticus parmotrematis TaxID=2873249 RepID=A0ABS7QPA1_9ACTN|nr:GYD domain-containing protein [Streptantibioticus parmotrematis]MBY8884997.1 GYD domain-containing protein [Streptantibioticus parmotrematis]